MGQFLNSINDVRKNYKKFDEWEQKEADKVAQKQWIAKNTEISPDKFEATKAQAEAIIRATEIMDARSEDNCENMEQLMGFAAAIPACVIPAVEIISLPFITRKVNLHYDKKITTLRDKLKQLPKSSEARQTLLESMKSLSAKKNKTLQNIAQGVNIGGTALLFLTTIGLIVYGNKKQKEASRIGRYQAKQDELKGLENFVIYTPEQIAEAKEIAKNIPDKDEKKSFIKMFQELKAMYKAKPEYKRYIKEKDPLAFEKLKSRNLTPEELEKAIEQKELITKVVSDVNIKAEEYSENLENAFDTFETISWLAAVPIGLCAKKLLGKFTKITPIKNSIISTIVGTITGLTISILGTFEQKNASRIGRYHARQDLLKNPEKMMVFSDEDMELAKEVKAEKQKVGIFKKMGRSFNFLKDYYKHKKGYKNYKQTTQKENEKLQKAFKETKITDEQKKDAKNLQANVFMAFDEVDEMSQRYSEDVEAATEIAKETLSTGWAIGSLLALAGLGLGIKNGRINLVKPINGLVNMTFKKESTFRQAINKLADLLSKQGRSGKVQFQKNLVTGKFGDYLAKAENAEVKEAVNSIKKEFNHIQQQSMLGEVTEKQGLKGILENLFNSHFKESRIAKWARSLSVEGVQLWLSNKAGAVVSEEMKRELGMNFSYKNYKTLCNTSIIAATPILGTIFAVPYAFNAWLTDIQKKAGKIGVMKAIEKIDDPKYYADNKS